MSPVPGTPARVPVRPSLALALLAGLLAAHAPAAHSQEGPGRAASAACPAPVTRETDLLPDGRAVSAAFDSLLRLVPATREPGKLALVPHTTAPDVTNRRRAADLLRRETRAIRETGATGKVQVALLIGTDGRLIKPWVTGSSGRTELDLATLRVVGGLRFRPARNGRCAVPSFQVIPFDWTLEPTGSR